MRLRTLLGDERVVSPVIGVILMVAVTVILAAVIGTFVLGIGQQVTTDTPKVSLGFDFDGNANGYGPSDGDDSVAVTHRGGDPVQNNAITVISSGTSVDGPFPNSEVTAGDTATISEPSITLESGNKVQVIWESPDGEGTAILGERKVP